ncbi:TPA: DUF2974 domain-containing protein [Streptococcus suis]
MANLLDYLKESQFDSFYDRPLNKLDILALTELAYLPFDSLVPADFTEKGVRIDQLAEDFAAKYQDEFPPFSMVTKSRLAMFQLLAQAKRFKHLRAFAYVDQYELDLQKQFAVISYRLDRQTIVTCFRGTDDTIIGWKEDFHMTYMEEIPAQKSAKEYLEGLIGSQPGLFYISGHSKGGNLALYASSKLAPDLQERILQVYPYDAPGLHKKHLESPSYLMLADRVHPIIPQNSVVGMMLETPDHVQIVQSNTIGLLQHISFSWEINGNDFKPAPALTEDSLQVDQTLKTWTASLTEEELQEFFDLFFGLIMEAGIEKLADLTVNPLQKLQEIDRLRKELPDEKAQMLDKLSRLLIDTRYKIWLEGIYQNLPHTNFKLPQFSLHFPSPELKVPGFKNNTENYVYERRKVHPDDFLRVHNFKFPDWNDWLRGPSDKKDKEN